MATAQPPPQSTSAGAFTFKQPPRSVAQVGAYRDPSDQKSKSSNIMHDRRVVRGNTYAAQVVSLTSDARQAPTTRRPPRRSPAASTKVASAADRSAVRSSTPDPIEGREHLEVQTEAFREELTDAVEEAQQETQTDPMLDRPPTPLFVPLKVGRDAETQVLNGELFVFNAEVDPILDVMVGKSLEQAMLEVQQEEELEALRQQQVEFEQRRKEEVLEMQRLAAAERRRMEEKERRKRQEKERIERERETREKLQSRLYAKSFLSNLQHRVFARLEDEGWFGDAVRREVELSLVPWLLQEVEGELQRHRAARQLVDDVIRGAITKL